MNTSGRQSWLTVILIGVLYSLIGIVLALPSSHVRMWRLAAWGLSAIVFAAHIGYELLRRGNSPAATALRVTLAVAVGGFGLALAANIHELMVMPSYRRALAVA